MGGKIFSDHEERVFFKVLDKYKHIIGDKTTNAEFNKLKKEAWDSIAITFNLLSGTRLRTVNQLRDKYRNVIKAAKKKARMAGNLSSIVPHENIKMEPLSSSCDSDPDSEIITNGVTASHNDSGMLDVDSDDMSPENLPIMTILTESDEPFHPTSTTNVGHSTKFKPPTIDSNNMIVPTSNSRSSQTADAIVATEHSRKRAIEAESAENIKLLKQEQWLGRLEHEQKMKIMQEEHLAKLNLLNAQIEYYVRMKQKSDSKIIEDLL